MDYYGLAKAMMLAQAEEITGRRMNVTRNDIDALPLEWASALADNLDPDGDLARDGYDPYDILRANWPNCREEVEAMLTDLRALQ